MRTTITTTLVHHGGATDDGFVTDEVHATSCVVTDTGIRTSIICGFQDEPRQTICEDCPFATVVTTYRLQEQSNDDEAIAARYGAMLSPPFKTQEE